MTVAMPALGQTEYLKSYNVQRALEVLYEDLNQAYQYVDKETDNNGDNAYAWYLLGNCHWRVDHAGTTLTYTNYAIEKLTDKKHKRIAEDAQWLAACYLQRAQVYEVLEQKEQQLADLNAAVKIGKFDEKTPQLGISPVDVLMARAQYYFDEENYSLADADYRSAIVMDSHDARPLIGLGRDALTQGNTDTALTYYLQSKETDPDYDPCHLYLMKAYFEQGNVDKFTEEMWEALQVENTQSSVIDFIMEDSVASTMAEPALKLLESKAPLETEMEIVRLFVLRKTNRVEETLQSITELQQNESLQDAMQLLRCSALRDLCRLDEALETAEQVVAKDSTDSEACLSMAQVLCDMSRYEEADVWVNRAIELNPENTDGYYWRSRINDRWGRGKEAIEAMRTALLLDPEDVSSHCNLMISLEAWGSKDEMQKEAEYVLEHDTIASRMSFRQYALMSLGRYDEAMAWLDAVAENWPYGMQDVLLEKAETMLRKGDAEAAKRYLVEAREAGYMRLEVLKSASIFRDHVEIFDNL